MGPVVSSYGGPLRGVSVGFPFLFGGGAAWEFENCWATFLGFLEYGLGKLQGTPGDGTRNTM